MSPGLKRAREPYRVKNAILGLALGAFAVGVWAYSISAVKQDLFDDVDEEARALGAGGAGPSSAEGKNVSETIPGAPAPVVVLSPTPAAVQNAVILREIADAKKSAEVRHRGILQMLGDRYPGLLDPERRTLVWGAPPVDDIGKMRKS